MFHSRCGKNVKLTNGGRTAEYTGGVLEGWGVVVSQEALTPGQPFTIRVEEGGGAYTLTLGVTQVDPDTRPQLPQWATEMKRACVVVGDSLYRDGEEEGSWSWALQASSGDMVSLLWDGADIYITVIGTKIKFFAGVTGPLWAVTEVDGGIPKLSIISPEPKAVARKAPPVPRSEPPKPTRGRDLTGAMNEMALGGPGAQSMGASGGLIPKRSGSITCPFWQVCNRFIDSLQLPEVYFDTKYNTCYCMSCHLSRGDDPYYTRGEPPKTYGLPLGWCRFGLSVPAKAHGLKAFEKWQVAYHGTIPENIRKIIESDLLMPGDYTLEGVQLAPPSGHFTDDRKPAGFDIKQVFVSPTITYAGHPVYARPQRWTDPKTKKSHDIQVALQVRIKPDSYQVGQETLGLGSKIIDAKFKNSELEWSTKIRGATIIQGILVKT